MSAKLMGMVFDLDLSGPPQTLMLCLADHANDNGQSVYPSIAYLAWKSGLSERTVQRTLRELEDMELLERTVEGRGRGIRNQWTIHIEKGVRKSPFREVKGVSVTPFTDPEKVTRETGKGDIAVSPPIEPSVEPSEKELLPTVVVPARQQNPIWDALEDEWGPAPKGSANHGLFVKATSMYRAADFTPDMVHEAHRLYREDDHFGTLAYTILAVAKNAQQLLRKASLPPPAPKIKSTAMRALIKMTDEEYHNAVASRVSGRNGRTGFLPPAPRELGDGGIGTRSDVREVAG